MKLLDSSKKSQLFFLSDRALIKFLESFWNGFEKSKPKKAAKR